MKGPLILFLLLFYEFVSSIPFNTLLVSFYLPTSAPITSNLLLKKSTISGVVVAQLAELSFPVPKVRGSNPFTMTFFSDLCIVNCWKDQRCRKWPIRQYKRAPFRVIFVYFSLTGSAGSRYRRSTSRARRPSSSTARDQYYKTIFAII